MKAHPDRIARGLYWDRAWSLVEGCTPSSEGCLRCWSAAQTHLRADQSNEKIRARYGGLTTRDGKFNGRARLMWSDINKPTPRQKPAIWCIWNDLFHADVLRGFVDCAFRTMALCKQHTFLVLTKRPDLMLDFTKRGGCFHQNILPGTTVENQKRADERIPILLQIPAAIRFVSLEPLLGPVDLDGYLGDDICIAEDITGAFLVGNGLDWVICGAETGPGKREMKTEWVRDVRDQCAAAGVPFFFKKDSRGGRLLDGRTWEQFPEVRP